MEIHTPSEYDIAPSKIIREIFITKHERKGFITLMDTGKL